MCVLLMYVCVLLLYVCVIDVWCVLSMCFVDLYVCSCVIFFVCLAGDKYQCSNAEQNCEYATADCAAGFVNDVALLHCSNDQWSVTEPCIPGKGTIPYYSIFS